MSYTKKFADPGIAYWLNNVIMDPGSLHLFAL